MKNYLSIYLSNEGDTAMNRTMVRSVLTNEQRSYQHESLESMGWVSGCQGVGWKLKNKKARGKNK